MNLAPHIISSSQVTQKAGGGWYMEIPAGPAGTYRLSQLDDYASVPRSRLPWNAPTTLSLRARVSEADLPGTWGFGLWNDPFSLSFGLGGMARRLPVLPNAAWFFFASKENYLSFREDKSAQGFLAATFRAPKIPSLLLTPALLATPLLIWPLFARTLRRLARKFVAEDSTNLEMDVTAWHAFRLEWRPGNVLFWVDESSVFETAISPHGPLGLVIWIDNQFAAFTPQGKIGTGTLENPSAAWLEIEDMKVERTQP
jgi:hypothetical protein